MGKYIPGNPTVVIQTMPGGAACAPRTFFNVAPKDGTALGVVTDGDAGGSVRHAGREIPRH
jgi:hypothetical protein